MFDFMETFYANYGTTASIFISLSIMLLSGFLLTRVCKIFRIPYVCGYIVTGIIIGPYVLNLIPSVIAKNLDFLSDIALAFIAFSVGKFLKKDIIKNTGKKVVVITLLESLLAGIAITLMVHFVFAQSWSFSLILGVIASATAPASTTMTIRQYEAKGDFINTLLQVIALDNVVCLFLFSIATAVGSVTGTAFSVWTVILPIAYNLFAILIAVVLGIILSKIINPHRSSDNRIILIIIMLLFLCGFCSILNISPLLSCMVLSATYVNLKSDDTLYDQANSFSAPVLSLFFIISGMNLDITTLKTVGIIGICYFLVRIIFKYLGSYVGAILTKSDNNTRRYLGLALIPQAGVAIGLAFLAERILPSNLGSLLLAIILASSVLYELFGPVLAKYAIIKSDCVTAENIKKNAYPIWHKPHDFSFETLNETVNLIENKTSENFETINLEVIPKIEESKQQIKVQKTDNISLTQKDKQIENKIDKKRGRPKKSADTIKK